MARALTPLPGSPPRTRAVIVPELAFLHVGRREFPVLFRLVEAIEKALLLLLARHVKEELQNFRPPPAGVVLEMRDVGEPLVPDSLADQRRRQLLRFEDLGMHSHDEDFLVVRTVEDASIFRPQVSPGSKSLSRKPLPLVTRNGSTYFCMRSRISRLGMSHLPWMEAQSTLAGDWAQFPRSFAQQGRLERG